MVSRHHGPRGSYRARARERERKRDRNTSEMEAARADSGADRIGGTRTRSPELTERGEDLGWRCEGRLGRHLPTGWQYGTTLLLWDLDATVALLSPPVSLYSRLLSSRHSFDLVAFVALGQRAASPPLPYPFPIRTLRILNSKLQNMLSGRYKSKVGKGMRERGRGKASERGSLLPVSPDSTGIGRHGGARSAGLLPKLNPK